MDALEALKLIADIGQRVTVPFERSRYRAELC